MLYHISVHFMGKLLGNERISTKITYAKKKSKYKSCKTNNIVSVRVDLKGPQTYQNMNMKY